MRARTVTIIAFASIALTGCMAPPGSYGPVPYAQMPLAAMQPLNSEPWVSTQFPAGTYQGAGTHLPFQTPNSLPLGAWNGVSY